MGITFWDKVIGWFKRWRFAMLRQFLRIAAVMLILHVGGFKFVSYYNSKPEEYWTGAHELIAIGCIFAIVFFCLFWIVSSWDKERARVNGYKYIG